MRTEYDVYFIDGPVELAWLRELAAARFGDLVKAVVDVSRGVMAVSGDLHADEEQLLLQQGSSQADPWGINLYPDLHPTDDWIECDSLINVRPPHNRSRGVEDAATRDTVRAIVHGLVRLDD
jgi:hypothetical protein